MSALKNQLTQRKEQFVLAMMLITLHLAIWFDFSSVMSRSLMLSHLGLFLIWQPVWRGDERLSIDNIIVFFMFTLTFTIWLNYWLLFAWLVILIGFISGRIAYGRSERIILILALSFLVLQLFFACIPNIVKIDIELDNFLIVFLPVLLVIILVFPISSEERMISSVDFIHAITSSMLTSLVALGSVLTMFLGESTYFIALTQTSLVIGGLILFISWLLTSRTEFRGMTQLWSSYMLNIGTPFEQWLSDLSGLNEKDLSAEEFLSEAMITMVGFSWISGVSWLIANHEEKAGNQTDNFIEVSNTQFSVIIYTYNPPGAALSLHCNLLIQLLNNFYVNKLRENELTRQAHLKAIYETGARITHDIKNLLQSFQAITSIISQDSSDIDSSAGQQVLKKQLPNLTQRLQLALDKLQTPEKLNEEEIYLKDWWNDVKKRNDPAVIEFQSEITGDPMIPVDLFDSVMDNLLENAYEKKIEETNIEIRVTLACNDDFICFTVCDTGKNIPENIARELLKSPIKSDNGLGIGLYQANKHAQQFNYQLRLSNNQPGRVCFELIKDSAS